MMILIVLCSFWGLPPQGRTSADTPLPTSHEASPEQSRAERTATVGSPVMGQGCVQPTHLGPAAAPSLAWPGRPICQSLSLRCEVRAKGGVEDGATGWDLWVQEDPPSNSTG